uniref:Uncharacterized protein n=1 Tax=Romanomermis culicivorax TaxID=13658 RepID=A0A915JUI8_ROMCU
MVVQQGVSEDMQQKFFFKIEKVTTTGKTAEKLFVKYNSGAVDAKPNHKVSVGQPQKIGLLASIPGELESARMHATIASHISTVCRYISRACACDKRINASRKRLVVLPSSRAAFRR